MVLATDSTGFCEMKIISICKHIDAIKQQGIHRRIYPSIPLLPNVMIVLMKCFIKHMKLGSKDLIINLEGIYFIHEAYKLYDMRAKK